MNISSFFLRKRGSKKERVAEEMPISEYLKDLIFGLSVRKA